MEELFCFTAADCEASLGSLPPYSAHISLILFDFILAPAAPPLKRFPVGSECLLLALQLKYVRGEHRTLILASLHLPPAHFTKSLKIPLTSRNGLRSADPLLFEPDCESDNSLFE